MGRQLLCGPTPPVDPRPWSRPPVRRIADRGPSVLLRRGRGYCSFWSRSSSTSGARRSSLAERFSNFRSASAGISRTASCKRWRTAGLVSCSSMAPRISRLSWSSGRPGSPVQSRRSLQRPAVRRERTPRPSRPGEHRSGVPGYCRFPSLEINIDVARADPADLPVVHLPLELRPGARRNLELTVNLAHVRLPSIALRFVARHLRQVPLCASPLP